MKKLVFTLIFFLIVLESYPQKSGDISTTYKNVLSGKVYDKATGKKLSNKELGKLLHKYPNIIFERIINEQGEYSKYYFDSNNIKHQDKTLIINRNKKNQIKITESFTDFIFTTIDKEILKSKDLKGSWIILRFELLTRFVRVPEILKLNSIVVELNKNHKIVPIVCFADSEQNIKSKFNQQDLLFKFVGDGGNFQEKYNIIQFPTTIILDTNGKVHKYFYANDKIDIENIILD